MLKEIKCDKFNKNIQNGLISFRNGLNVVLGSNDAANSIGKSTLLLIIDFCFGGSTYCDQKDFFEYIGHHEVFFTFAFDGMEYHFSRETSQRSRYFECDSSYSHLGESKPIEKLNSFLLSHYFPNSNATFRFLVSRFMRIHGKNNYDVQRPLKGDPNEKEFEEILSIEDLFGIAFALKELKKNYKTLNEQKKALLRARKFGYVNDSIKSEKQLKEAKDKIEELMKDLEKTVGKIENDEILCDSVFSEKDIEFATAYRGFQRKLIKLKNELRQLQEMSGASELMTDDDLAKLKSFFPSFEAKSLEEINLFQTKLIENVNFEIRERKKVLESEILALEAKAADLKSALDKAGIPFKLSRAKLEYAFSRRSEIDDLKKQIDSYQEWNTLKINSQAAFESLNQAEKRLTPKMESDLNSKMMFLNRSIYSEERQPPIFKIIDSSHYSFINPADSGTGTRFKSLLLFDIAVLELSSLPVLIHDSLLFKNIWNQPIEGIFREYVKSKKQIFVAIDRIADFNERTKEIINENKVVSLNDGQDCLFGFSWAKKGNL